MYAIVSAQGVQYKVHEGMKIRADYIIDDNLEELAAGTQLTIPTVIMLSTGEHSIFGKPVIEGAAVEAEVVNYSKGEKIVVFKKKRRKGYSKKQGHRQKYTMLKINKINVPEGLF